MRILILNRVEPPAPGATGRLVHELSVHLRAASHEVQTITTGKLPARIIPYLFSWLSIGLTALLTRRADRVVVMSDPPMLALWIPILKWRHGKIIYWCQDLYPDAFPVIGIHFPKFIQEYLVELNRWALRAVDKIITLGECMATRLRTYAENITIIANWAERDITSTEVSEAEPLTILYAGNIGLVHPVDAIVTAIQSCRHLPVKFILMAGGKGEEVLKNKLSDQVNVTFLPPQPWERAKTIQSMCHLHIIALKDEALGVAMPVKTYAAIQNGRPYVFIGPRDCEAAQLAITHDCGEVLAPADSVNFVKVIQKYTDDNGLPNAHWRKQMQNVRAISLPDSLQAVAEAVLSA